MGLQSSLVDKYNPRLGMVYNPIETYDKCTPEFYHEEHINIHLCEHHADRPYATEADCLFVASGAWMSSESFRAM